MKKELLILILILLIIAVNGCVSSGISAEKAKQICISECLKQKSQIELNSQCLLNPISNTTWVCDVAHQPRQDIDNLAENQCSLYRDGKAKHFVEVSPECEFIRAV